LNFALIFPVIHLDIWPLLCMLSAF
jgi:hypothetical protein